MGCGCNGHKPPVAKYTWTSTDGKQTVTGLSATQAQTRQNRKGGTVALESR